MSAAGAADVATLELSSRSVEETERWGAALAPGLEVGDVVTLSGPLGAGKTRLVAGIARGLEAAARVRSPSFAIINEYRGRLLLLHLDLYRLEEHDSSGLGLEEQTERGALVVEWGEKLDPRFTDEALHVEIEPVSETQRLLHAQARHGRGVELLHAWRARCEEGSS